MKPIHIYLNYSMACIKSNFFVDLISKIGDKNKLEISHQYVNFWTWA